MEMAAPDPTWTLTNIIVVLKDSALTPLSMARPTLTVFLIAVGKYLPLTLPLACKMIFLLKLPIEKK